MTTEPNDQEFAAVLKLSSEERYLHFLKHAVDVDQVWMVKQKEGEVVSIGTPDGGEALPVWAARRYAEHGTPNLPDAEFLCLSIQDWIGEILQPELDTKDFAIAIFSDADGEVLTVSIRDVVDNVRTELSTRLGSLPRFAPDADDVDLN